MKTKNKQLFKRIFVLSLSLCLGIATFAGCKDDEEEKPTVETEEYYDPMAGIDTDTVVGALVADGKTSYKIVIPAEASECEAYAAEELQKYIKQSSGATLPIVRDNSGVTLGQKLVSIGNTNLVSAAQLDTTNLNVDGFRLKTEGETLLIKGERDRGTLYGVYDFLEKFVGTRFLYADFEYVPTVETVELYKSDVTEIPEFALRSRFDVEIGTNMAGGARMRFVSNRNASGAATAKFGGGYFEDFIGEMHSYNGLLDWRIYGQTKANHAVCENQSECTLHTDWYATPKDNTGEGDPFPQWCISNGLNDDGTISDEEGTLVKAAIAAAKAKILTQPTGLYLAFSQNDNRNVCMCDDCIRQQELFGGFGGHTVVFTNAVAKAVNESLQAEGFDHEVKFIAYAYMYTIDAPKADAPSVELAVPNEYTYMMLCPYDDYYNYPLRDKEGNANFALAAEGWSKISNQFMAFDYTNNFTHTLLWYPNFGVLKDNVLFYKELGVNGIVASGTNVGYEATLQTYLLSKLFWNANRDVNALIHEFNVLYFGSEEAGAVMDRFVEFNNAWYEYAATEGGTKARQKVGLYSRTWQTSTSTLSVDYVRQNYRLLDEAKALILADETTTTAQKNVYLKNLMRAEVMIDFSKYYNYDALFKTTAEEEEAFMRSFYEKLTTLKVTSFGMGWTQSVAQVFAEKGIY